MICSWQRLRHDEILRSKQSGGSTPELASAFVWNCTLRRNLKQWRCIKDWCVIESQSSEVESNPESRKKKKKKHAFIITLRH